MVYIILSGRYDFALVTQYLKICDAVSTGAPEKYPQTASGATCIV